MAIVPRRPFWDLDRWFEEEWPEEWEWPEFRFPRIIPELPSIRTPRMDIYESDGDVIAEVELPGVDPKNIEIEVRDKMLKVEAKTEEKKEEKKKGYYRKEIAAGYYKRIVPLPAEVIGEKATATYKGGMLKIVIPKAKPKKEEKKGVKVKVKSAKKE